MLIRDLVTADALPALEATMRFAAQRQRIISNNIANFDTPGYRAVDVSVDGFQKALGRAVDARRDATSGVRGSLPWRETSELRGADPSRMTLHPTERGGLLFHDQGARDLERTMQDLVENTATFQVAAKMYASRMRVLQSAISERVA